MFLESVWVGSVTVECWRVVFTSEKRLVSFFEWFYSPESRLFQTKRPIEMGAQPWKTEILFLEETKTWHKVPSSFCGSGSLFCLQ